MTVAERALADLSEAVTSYLQAEPDSLLPLVVARDRAHALLAESRPASAPRCDCGARSGFHTTHCAIAAPSDTDARPGEGER